MTRSYELGFVLEPRVPEDEAQALCDKFKDMITDSGATVTYVDHWGKRKLAYPIRKFSEGRYFFIYVSTDVTVPWSDIERLMMQDEKILRHLVVRTDEDLKRAYRKGKIKPQQPGDEEEEASDKPAASEKTDQAEKPAAAAKPAAETAEKPAAETAEKPAAEEKAAAEPASTEDAEKKTDAADETAETPATDGEEGA